MKDYKKHQSVKRPAKIIEHVTHPQIPDFRIEIEKRYSKSIVNKIYTFPKKEVEEANRGEEQDESLDFLEKITVYDLMAQNVERQKKKRRKQKNFTRKQRNSYRYNLSTSLNQTNTRDSNTRTHKKALYQKSLDLKDKALQRSLELKKKSSKRTIFKHSKTPRYSEKPHTQKRTKKNTKTYSSLLGILKQNVANKKRTRP